MEPLGQEDLGRLVAASIEHLSANMDLTALTMRQVKEAIKVRAKLSEAEWERVLGENKLFLKEEARRQLDLRIHSSQEMRDQRHCGLSSPKERKSSSAYGSHAEKDKKRAPRSAKGTGNEDHVKQKKRKTSSTGSKAHVTTIYQPVEAIDSCEICKRNVDDDKILLCDGCDLQYHLYCLKPPLDSVPQGDWYCENCARPIPAELESLSSKELKELLKSRNCSFTGCVEKKDLVELIRRVFLV